MSTPFLLLLTAGSIATLLVLIMGLKMQAFVALLLVSMGVAIIGGIPLPEVAALIQEGMGSTLGYIAIIIGLGTMIGDRKSTRLNSSHVAISYAVFCLKKKKRTIGS